jgi:hypothetical protein
LAEYLSVLAEARQGDDDDGLRQCLAGGCWWLSREQANDLAAELAWLLTRGDGR